MGLLFVFCVILLLCKFQYTNSQRRIVEGKPVNEPIPYMAYLLKAPTVSPKRYDAWLCGAAIVSERALVTSAACIEDVQYMYVVAGYKRYVKAEEIKTNECTKNARKKVILSCVPKSYEFDYDNVEQWTNIDIGIVFVETQFEFNKKIDGCSWAPNMIAVNYHDKYQRPDTDAVVMGFGHSDKWREVRDQADHNQKTLQYTAVSLARLDECKKSYEKYPKMLQIIDKYMICTKQAGELDYNGKMIKKLPHDLEGCVGDRQDCNAKPNTDGKEANDTDMIPTRNKKSFSNPGICQNDHGGPLVAWVGDTAHLIGVASLFMVHPRNKKCTGPYLYTSTYCNSKFLNCAIKNMTDWFREHSDMTLRSRYQSDPDYPRRQEILNGYDAWYKENKEFCELPAQQRGFRMVTRRISWAHHPDGPAKNELDDMIKEQNSLQTLSTKEFKAEERILS